MLLVYVDVFLSLTPDHTNNWCNDENLKGCDGHCSRCGFLWCKRHNMWDPRLSVIIDTQYNDDDEV